MSDDKPLQTVSEASRPARALAEDLAPAKRRWTNRPPVEQDVSPRFLLSVWAQWWKLLLPLTFLMAAGSISLVMYFFQPQYRASAWLQIKGVQPFVAFPEEAVPDRDAAKKYVHT